MNKTLYRELNLNTDSIANKRILAAMEYKLPEAEMTMLINSNPSLRWMTTERADLETIRVCCEEIIARGEIGTLDLKMAKQILKLLNQPRSVSRKVVTKRSGRAGR